MRTSMMIAKGLLLGILLIALMPGKIQAQITLPPGFEASVFASTGLVGPIALAFDSSENLFVANLGPLTATGDCDGFVAKIAPDGMATIFASGPWSSPVGLAFDSSGFLFVSDTSAGRPCNPNEISIFRISPAGVIEEFAGDFVNDGVVNSKQIAFNPFGDLIVVDNEITCPGCGGGGGGLFKITSTGEVTIFVLDLVNPVSIAIDTFGNSFVGDSILTRVGRTSGTIERITSTGGRNTFATNLSPSGLAFDASNRLFVADSGRILIIDDANGNDVADPDEMCIFATGLAPGDIAFDNAGNLFVTEPDLNRIIKISRKIITAPIDIKPQSCPNPLNINSQGVLPVAILGTEDFDVSTINPTSIQLSGVTPIRSSIKDVGTPFTDKQDECDCSIEAGDGLADLTMKFDTQEIVNALGEVADGDELVLALTGELLDGTPIKGEDCIVVLSKGRKGEKNKALYSPPATAHNQPNGSQH